MNLGDNMMILRKRKKLSQAALGEIVGTSGDVIGRYERGDISPSIQVASKIADALEVSLDYLIGKTSVKVDQNTLKKLEFISDLPDDKKAFILNMIDMAIRDAKL